MFSKEISLTIAFLIAFALLLLNFVVCFWAVETLVFNSDKVSHSYEVRIQLRHVLVQMQDAENGQRGFVITGRETYLEPYKDALTRIDDSVNKLQALTADNQAQQARIVIIREKITNKIAELNITINIRREKGFAEAQALILTDVGKREMDEIRKIILEMRDDEIKIFDTREARNISSQRTAFATLIIAGLVNLGLIIVLFFYIKNDFQRRTKSAETLRQSQQFSQAIINSLGSHLAVIDQEGSITAINSAWKKFTEENLAQDIFHRAQIGSKYTEVCWDDLSENIEESKLAFDGISDVMNGKKSEFSFEYSCRPKNEERWFLMTVTPLETSGRGAVISHTDITYLKKLEIEREKVLDLERLTRTELENINRAKDEFLATVSHELRTPLNAILGWASMLKNGGDVDEEIRNRAFETIERNARVQAQLIEDLLDVSRIISGKLRLEIQPAKPAESIHAALNSVRPAALAKKINLEAEIDQNNFYIAADSGRLQQVWWNLLLNAIKFTPESGTVKVLLTKSDHKARIEIADTGAGISPEFLPFIFERFRQADGSSTRRHGGLGLGLSIVKNLVELHGGTISVTSEGENKGTEFIVEIPLLGDNIEMFKKSDETVSASEKKRQKPGSL